MADEVRVVLPTVLKRLKIIQSIVARLPCADMQQPIRRRNYWSAIGLYFGTNAFITHHATT